MVTYHALGVDVADISADAGGALDVEEGELSDARVELEEERQRLANSAAGTENGNLGKLHEARVSEEVGPRLMMAKVIR